jgi:starch-binding outer membrane protein, SusD/RagB family
MKKILFIALLALAVPLQGCDSVFEGVEPRTAVSSEIALTSVEGFEALLISVYDRLQRYQRYGNYFMLYPDALADNLTHTTQHSNRFPAVVTNQSGTHMNEWSFPYVAINEANNIIARIDDLDVDFPNLEQVKRRIKGEAYFLRALNYFDLVRTKAYEPGQEVGGFTQGVILRTQPTDTVEEADFRARSSNVEVYQRIEADLIEAAALLQGSGNTRNFANRAAALSLLSRVYLYWGRWADAENLATQGLDAAGINLVQDTGNNQYYNAWQATSHPEAIFELIMTPGTDGDATNSNQALNALTWGEQGNQSFSFEAIPTQDLMNAHEEGDARSDLYAEGRKGAATIMYIQKWPGNVAQYVSNIPVIRLPELYLNRAEARAEQANYAGARSDLNTLRNARGLEDVDAGLAGQALIDAILHERRLEFAFEGHRFFDLKRRGMDIPKPQTDAGFIAYTDHRILAPLPSGEVQANPLLDQNPGY